MDITSKSDPLCVLYLKQFASSDYREVGRTEVIWNTLNPDFVRKFVLDYFFEESQKLRFDLYDVDSLSNDLSKHDFLGEFGWPQILHTSTNISQTLNTPNSNIFHPHDHLLPNFFHLKNPTLRTFPTPQTSPPTRTSGMHPSGDRVIRQTDQAFDGCQARQELWATDSFG